jgi:hypothetical protein
MWKLSLNMVIRMKASCRYIRKIPDVSVLGVILIQTRKKIKQENKLLGFQVGIHSL